MILSFRQLLCIIFPFVSSPADGPVNSLFAPDSLRLSRPLYLLYLLPIQSAVNAVSSVSRFDRDLFETIWLAINNFP